MPSPPSKESKSTSRTSTFKPTLPSSSASLVYLALLSEEPTSPSKSPTWSSVKLRRPLSFLPAPSALIANFRARFQNSIGCPSPEDAALWHGVFDTPMFHVHCVEDVAGVSLAGALKNVVAMAAGFVDGMGMGGNTKAAILRIGLMEMAAFTLEFFPSSSPETFSHHSAGMADLVTSESIWFLFHSKLS